MGLTLLLVVGCIPHLYSSDSGGLGAWEQPENSWVSGTPPSDLTGEGFFQGEVVPDLRGLDQFGSEVSLWQFYGHVLVLDISTMWCAPCQDLARGVQETAEFYEDQGLVYLTLLGEDVEGNPSTAENCQEWADAFSIESPIITDPDEVRWDIVTDNSYPRVMIINTDMRVLIEEIESPTDPKIRDAIEGAL
jgi:thiol-disulfide isomerase/thioredoxin